MELKTKDKLLLWAWIHDLGKLAWRWWYKRRKTNYDVAHAEILVEMFDELTFNQDWKQIAYIASLHHAKDFNLYKDKLQEKDKFLAWCIYMADNISAKERNLDYKKDLKNTTKNQAIENIFNRVFEEEKEIITDNLKTSYFDANTLTNVSSSTWINSKQESDFKKLYESFKNDLKIFSNWKITQNTIFQLDVLLQNYLTFVPSDAYKSIPDISLYDHSKTVVMFANILYEKYKDFKNKELLYNINKTTTDKVLSELEISLIWWDFPSIQKYIIEWIKNSKILQKDLEQDLLRCNLFKKLFYSMFWKN